MESKICTKCKVEQSIDKFYAHTNNKPNAACKACENKPKKPPYFVPTLDGEIWRPVPIENYKNHFMVSNLSRVKRVRNRTSVSERLMTQTKCSGYLNVKLSNNGESHNLKVHRLVALAFIDNPGNKPNINHDNGIRSSNFIENLEWCTQKENAEHSIRTKLQIPFKGSECGMSKLTEKEVKEIKDIGRSVSGLKLAKRYNVSHVVIYGILNGKSWKHVK